MIILSRGFALSLILTLLSINLAFTQEKKFKKQLAFYDYRGVHSVSGGGGIALIDSDFIEQELRASFYIGYKFFVIEHLNVNLKFHKYALAYDSDFDTGFMSYDANIEFLPFPYSRFTPFIYAGYGYNTDDDFEISTGKIQGGLGMEYIVTDKLGLKLYGEYNYTSDDELDGFVAGSNNDGFLRAGLGINFYFGGNNRKEEIMDNTDTVIKSNPIPIDN